jgi:phosphinothricin acetyltransferase
MLDLTIRPAAETDASTIAAIYNHYVRTSTATFDTKERSVPDQAVWLTEHVDPFPVIVAENSDGVVAWGALSAWGTRCAYRHTVEISVYVAADAAGQGIGPALTEVLIGRARELRHHAIISQIVHENNPSLSMARRLGFEHVGTLREVGRKFDRWLDVVLMELVLDTEADSEANEAAT